MAYLIRVAACISLLSLSACSSLSLDQTRDLAVGMTPSQVMEKLDEKPESTENVGGNLIWKYSFNAVPYYLTFDKNKRLVSWKANMAEYRANMDAWAAFGESVKEMGKDMEKRRVEDDNRANERYETPQQVHIYSYD